MAMEPVEVGVDTDQIRQVTGEWDIWEGVGPLMDIRRQWCTQVANCKQQQLEVLVPLVPEVHR